MRFYVCVLSENYHFQYFFEPHIFTSIKYEYIKMFVIYICYKQDNLQIYFVE